MDFSEREILALQCIADGLTNKAMAGKLGYTFHSLNGYLTELYRKMKVQTRTQAAVMALRKGLVH